MPFVKGQPKPPNSGRRKGVPNKVRRIRRGPKVPLTEDERIITDVISKAKKGDIEFVKLYLRHLRAPPQMFLGPYTFKRPADLEEARAALLTLAVQLAAGKISLELHDAIREDIKIFLGSFAIDKLKLAGNSFVVVENNSGFELPIPADDAAMAGEPATTPAAVEPAPSAPSADVVAALRRALDATPDADVVSQPELPNILAFPPPAA
jgi:hypothetical protein